VSKALDLSLPSPVGDLQAYEQAVKRFPMLSAEEERALAERYRSAGDLTAAWRLVTSHLRFVVKVARGYRGYGLSEADLIQEGNLGLMKAVKRFDPSHGVRLVSFAVHWIRAEIHEFILRNWRIVKIATTKAQRKLFFNLRGAKKRLGWLSRDELNEVASEFGVDADEVLEMERRLSARDEAFDVRPEREEEGEWLAPAAYLDDLRYEPSRLVEGLEWETKNGDRLQVALAKLDERSRAIVTERWLRDDKKTLQELAAEHGVSAERIRQLEAGALRRLRAALAA